MNKGIIAGIIVLGLSGSYGYLYQDAKSKLNLAELKSDLDEMYSPLEALSKLQIPSAKTKFQEVSKAIVLREEMLRAVSDHNHEDAVLSAAELLTLFPKHKDGIKILRESGQIFYLMRNAKNLVSRALNSESPTVVEFQKVLFNQSDKSDKELVEYIQTGLNELGHYNSEIDGISGKGTIKAIESFKEDNKIKTNLGVDLNTANLIKEKIELKKAKKEYLVQIFQDMKNARQYTESSVKLDPRFDRADKLLKNLDRAHEAISLIVSL